MAHGTADWGQSTGAVTTFQLTDLGELAARLWSPDYFDRRGEAIFMEDFECGSSRFFSQVSGTGASVGIVTNEARSGGNSAQLICGSDNEFRASILKYVGLPPRGLLGIEGSARLVSGAAVFELLLEFHNGAAFTTWHLRYDAGASILEYLGSDNTEHIFVSSLVLPATPSLFHTMKFVADSVAGKYVRAIVNGVQYDLSTIAGHAGAGGSGSYLIARWSCLSGSGGNETIYLDDVIVTQNEPV